jgi:hypothetical protein
MIKQLSLLMLATISGISFAMEDNAGYAIQKNEWEMIKEAVFAKMGDNFKQQFNKKYPMPSDDGVRALADQFDECDPYGEKYKYNIWIDTYPAKLPIWIDRKCYYVVRYMADIIVAHKKPCRARVKKRYLRNNCI